jgi:hypothetical protein
MLVFEEYLKLNNLRTNGGLCVPQFVDWHGFAAWALA